MKSMTGYGRAVAEENGLQVAVEISSVNRKNLDISISLPKEWHRLETPIAERVRGEVQRGRVNLAIATESPERTEGALFDPAAVEAAVREFRNLSAKLDVPFQPDLNFLVNVASVARNRVALPEADKIAPRLLEAVREALAEMVEMRSHEGEVLAKDLAMRMLQIGSWLGEIRECSAGVVPDYRETLLKRLRQSGLDFTLEDDRVLKEIAVFADRCDISEELTRLESHLAQFEEFLRSEDPVGRKMEFLLQEIGREFNTIGSKASDSAISRLVIESKNELERIREQVQNLE